MITSRSGFMSNPRLRGKYQKAIRGAVSRRNQPGQDFARHRQGQNATMGSGTYRTTQRPRFNAGHRIQQVRRNPSNEQGGLGRPAQPHAVQYAPPQRRNY